MDCTPLTDMTLCPTTSMEHVYVSIFYILYFLFVSSVCFVIICKEKERELLSQDSGSCCLLLPFIMLSFLLLFLKIVWKLEIYFNCMLGWIYTRTPGHETL